MTACVFVSPPLLGGSTAPLARSRRRQSHPRHRRLSLRSVLLTSFFFLLLLSLGSSSADDEDDEDYSPDDDDDEDDDEEEDDSVSPSHHSQSHPYEKCSLYLAPSSIPNAGLGTYTSIPLEPRDPAGAPEPALHIFDLPFHNTPDEANAAIIADYDWAGSDYLGHLEARKVQTVIPGLGGAINSHPGLHNVLAGHPLVDSAGLDRSRADDAGVGAFTYYHSVFTYAMRSVEAGSELFAHYSDPYFLDRTDVFGMIPLAQDFYEADEIVAKFDAFARREEEGADDDDEGIGGGGGSGGGGGIGVDVLKDLWMTIRRGFEEDDRTVRLGAALPETLDDVRTAAGIGETGSAHLSLPSSVRSQSWLERKGMCVDIVEPENSTLPQAGRGGFAVRRVTEGEVVLPLPLLHINRTLLDMKTLRNDPEFDDRILKGKEVVGRQLLLNYCYGHAESSVLLFPYSSGSGWINHASGGEGGKANVKLRWHVPRKGGGGGSAGRDGDDNDDGDGDDDDSISGFHHPEWLSLSAREVLSQKKTGLLMDLIATRDIERGEELFLDYGPGWEAAWEEHVASWPGRRPLEEAENYTYPHVIDEDKYSPLRTHAEEKEQGPYPPNVVTGCFYNAPSEDYPLDPNAERRLIRDPNDPTNDNRTVTAVEVPWNNWGMNELSHPTLRPCRIIGRRDNVRETKTADMGDGTGRTVTMKSTELLYTALMKSWDYDLPKEERHVVHGIPRAGIMMADRPYTSDQHLRGVFRREIGVPDEIFPEAWKDLKS